MCSQARLRLASSAIITLLVMFFVFAARENATEPASDPARCSASVLSGADSAFFGFFLIWAEADFGLGLPALA